MGYCTKTDIEADFKGISFGTDQAVKASELNTWIEQESNYIDARVSLRYISPVDATLYPEAFSILKRIAIFRVSDRVRNVIEIKTCLLYTSPSPRD